MTKEISLREMSEKLDVRPSIERLCDTVMRYAPDKKGIVYAIDIKHAEHIAEYYRERGLKAYGYEVKKNGMGLLGVIDNDGNEVLPYIYNKVELKARGLAKLYSKKKFDRERPWMDLKNGVRFVRRPKIVRYGFLDFSTTDGRLLYPRVKTRRMDENCFVMLDALTNGIEKGLQFRTFYIQPSEPERLYIYIRRRLTTCNCGRMTLADGLIERIMSVCCIR